MCLDGLFEAGLVWVSCNFRLCILSARVQVLGYALVSFATKTVARTTHVYGSVYYFGHVGVFLVIALSFVVPAPKPKGDRAPAKTSKAE